MSTTASREREEYTMLHMVNRMIWEARRNDEIRRKYEKTEETSDMFPSTEKLLQSLTRQAPNRVYFGLNGRVCRVLFFSEEGLPYQARIETIELGDDPKIVKSEEISGRSIAALEQEITWWRRQFGMTGDLLSNPLLVLESLDRPEEIVHIGEVDNQVYCRYSQSSLGGPRFGDLGVDGNYRIGDEKQFQVLEKPPAFLIRHLNPFSSVPYTFPNIPLTR